MSTPTDQSTECSQENMGDTNTKNDEASNGLKSEKDYFHSTRYKQLYAYFIVALRNCSEETRNEFADALEELDLDEVDVEKQCRRLEDLGDE